MLSEEEIRQALDNVSVPRFERSLGSLNMVRSVEINDHSVKLGLAGLAMVGLPRQVLEVCIDKELKNLPGIDRIEVTYVESKPTELNAIGQVIAIMSGKGGVGKSMVSGLIATDLKRRGYSVGILDADITGPSIPKMFGIKEKPIVCQNGVLPVLTASGIAVMSINLILEKEDEAVIWRGPLIANAITQFWEEVYWGKLDYLIVDLPPGTADVPLTVLKTLPISGVVMVFTPQELTTMIVRKAVKMVHEMGKRIIGVVENMSYLYLDDIDRKIEIFGASRGEEMAAVAGAPILAQIPIDPRLAKLCDEGRIEDYQSEFIGQFADGIKESLSRDGGQEVGHDSIRE